MEKCRELIKHKINNKSIVICSLANGLYITNPNYLYEWEKEVYALDLLNEDISYEELRVFRERMEQESFRDSESAPKLKDIYLKSGDLFKNPQCAYELELQTYYKNLIINIFALFALQEAIACGKKIYLINDLGIEQYEVEKLLENADMGYLIKKCNTIDYGKKLLDFSALPFTTEDYKHILYIGGWNTVQDAATSVIEKLLVPMYEELRYEKLMNQNLSSIYSVLRNVWGVVAPFTGDTKRDGLFRYGFHVIGPLVVSYAEWLLKYAIEHNIHQICPLMRDGYLLTSVLNMMCEDRDITDIKITPLFVSRKALFLWDFNQSIEQNLKQEINLNPARTLESLYISLGITSESIDYADAKLKDLENIPYLQENRTLFSAVVDEIVSHKEKIYEQQYRKEKKIFQYFCQQIDVNEAFISADFGFAGTIAEKIDNVIFKNTGKKLQKAMLMCGSTRQMAVYTHGTNVSAFLYNFGCDSQPYSYSSFAYSIIENFLMNDLGSTIDYSYDLTSNTVVPIHEEYSCVDMTINTPCHEGVLFYLKCWLETAKISKQLPAIALSSKDFLTTVINRALLYPTYKEVEVLEKIRNENSFLSSDFCKYIIDNETIRLVQNLKIDNYLLIEKKDKSSWIAGSAEKVYPGITLIQLVKKYSENIHELYSILLLEKIVQKKITNVMIYGIGQKGLFLYLMLMDLAVSVTCFIDRAVGFRGKTKYNVPIVSPNEINGQVKEHIVIASSIYQKEIYNSLVEKGVDEKLIIFV